MVALQKAGANVFDYGNNIRGEAKAAGYADAFSFQGFVPAYIRPLFCRGNGPFRWAALSGDPADIARTDRAVLETFPDNEMVTRWIRMAAEKVHFQGLPAVSAGSSTASAPSGRGLQPTSCRRRGQSADRDRP